MRRASSIAVLLLLALSPAMAQQRAAAALQAADSNGDGAVSRAEFLAARAQQFTQRDRNQDGFLDAADAGKRAANRPRARAIGERVQGRLDSNGDGKLDKDEFVDGALAWFERLDKDGNGSIDAKEMQTSAAAPDTSAVSGAILDEPAPAK